MRFLPLLLAVGCVKHVAPSPPDAFDPVPVWTEFEALLRDDYAYVARDGFDVDAQLAHMRALAVAAPDEASLRRVLHRGMFAFTDPHVVVGPLDGADPNVVFTSSDLVIGREGEGWVVVDVRLESLADEAGVRPGWFLATVDGQPVEAAVEALWGGAVLAKTPEQWAYGATLAANGRREGERVLGFVVDGAEREMALGNPRDFARQVQERAPLAVSRHDGMVVMRVENALGDDALITAFDDALREALDADTLVLDLRNTPSGGNTNVARAIMGHFVDDVRAYQVHDIPAIERATTVPRRFVEQVLPREPRYPGRLVVLGGRWSGSMGEGLVIGLDAAAEAEVFASDMGDLLGGLYNVDLERAGIRIDLGVERLFHVDGTPREDFVAEHALAVADRGPEGADAGMDAVLDWLGRQGSASE